MFKRPFPHGSLIGMNKIVHKQKNVDECKRRTDDCGQLGFVLPSEIGHAPSGNCEDGMNGVNHWEPPLTILG